MFPFFNQAPGTYYTKINLTKSVCIPRGNFFKEDIIQTIEELKHKENTRADILYKMGFSKLASKNILDINF